MKKFVDKWLLAIPEILRQELSQRAELMSVDTQPSQAGSLTVSVSMGGERFLVATEADALHSLLSAAGLAASEPDSERDAKVWCELVGRAAATAGRALGKMDEPLVQNWKSDANWEATWDGGASSASFELRLGAVTMRLGFAPDREPTATASVSNGGTSHAASEQRPGVELLLDVELEASLRFGSCEMFLNEVLELGPGDVVELDRHVADPVDLLVGDKIVARGEVVLVNGNFGLRIQEVAEPKQCLESVRCLF